MPTVALVPRTADPPSLIARVRVLGRALQVVQLLLRAGASPSMLDEDGQTALHHAAAEGHVGALNALAPDEKCAELFVVDKYQMTPFHLACENGHADAVAYLLALYERTEGEKQRQATHMRRGSAVFLAEKNGHEAVVGLVKQSSNGASSGGSS